MLDDETKNWVAQAAAQFFSHDGLDANQLQFRLIHAADRNIYRIDLPGSKRFLVLKIWGTDESGHSLKKTSSSVRDEYEKTRIAHQAWSSVGHGSHAITEPLAVSDTKQALLLTGCPGDDFSKYLNKRLLFWPFLQSGISRRFRGAGEWLGHFHAATQRMEDGVKYLEIRTTHLSRMLEVIQRNASDSSLGRPIAAAFNELVNAGGTIPIALIHGNYALRNLLVAETSVSSIDFEESRRECSAYDVGQFVAEILVRGFVPTVSRRLVGRSIRNFLDGYASKMELDAGLLNAYVGYHLVAFYFEHARRDSLNSVSKMRRNHIRRELVRWIP